MTTPYIPILDSEVDPDAPITSSLMYRLRDNLIAVTEGDPAAPSVNAAIISQGGAGTDGHFNNGTTISTMGWFDFDLMAISAAKTIPAASVIRINGNASLSDVLTIQRMNLAAHSSAAQVKKEDAALLALGFQRGTAGGVLSTSGLGGALGGDGAGSAATQKIDFSFINRRWMTRHPYVGGVGGFLGVGSGTDFGEPGGCVVIIVEGDFDCTGGTIDASANPVDNTGAGGNTPGSGSGGTIMVICTGTITNGTFLATSGSGLNSNLVGGGGVVDLVATAFVGTQTIDVTHATFGTTTNATNGVSSSTTLTRDQIRTLIQRWI